MRSRLRRIELSALQAISQRLTAPDCRSSVGLLLAGGVVAGFGDGPAAPPPSCATLPAVAVAFAFAGATTAKSCRSLSARRA
jgi:hypothetical protein